MAWEKEDKKESQDWNKKRRAGVVYSISPFFGGVFRKYDEWEKEEIKNTEWSKE